MDYESLMRRALEEAKKAAEEGEVPVGALIVKDGVVVGVGRNTREGKGEIHGHAEINAILDAEKNLGSWTLEGCALIVTLEPCLMCSGAIMQSRISTIVYGAEDEEMGAVRSKFHVFDEQVAAAKPLIYSGVLAEECSAILRNFFHARRNARE